MSEGEQRIFKNADKLTTWVRWFLYLQVGLGVAAILSSLLEFQLLSNFESGGYTSEASAFTAAEASDARQSVVGIAQLLNYLILTVLIAMWIYRANNNVRALGAANMDFTPGWSVGWYFIPIASLWKPYQAMKEIWKASASPSSWSEQNVPSMLPWWWFFWIVSSWFGSVAFPLALRGETIDQLIAANIVGQLSEGMEIAASLLLLAIVKRVHAMQSATARGQLVSSS